MKARDAHVPFLVSKSVNENENLDLFKKMKEGKIKIGKHVLRAKIDMFINGCLRKIYKIDRPWTENANIKENNLIYKHK